MKHLIATVLSAASVGLAGQAMASNKVLVVLSGADSIAVQNAAPHPTGFFLVELAGPALALKEQGFELVYANPTGVKPVMDKTSDDIRWFKDEASYKKAKAFVANNPGLDQPRKLSSLTSADLKSFAGLFVPGGHAPMTDLYKDPDLGRILRYFNKHQKVTALICHGPVALASAKDAKGWVYEGYRMTGFSNVEEKIEENNGSFGGNLEFYLEDRLKSLGGVYSAGKEWTSHVVQDRELITGQNPMSEDVFTETLIRALTK